MNVKDVPHKHNTEDQNSGEKEGVPRKNIDEHDEVRQLWLLPTLSVLPRNRGSHLVMALFSTVPLTAGLNLAVHRNG